MGTTTIDLNADLGESFGAWRLGDDFAMLDIVSSANIACGFHAGDPATMSRTVRDAVERGVRVGAQVSYPDLVGFGRRDLDVPSDQLTADVLYQIGALDGFCGAAGTSVSYVKPHGALYNRIVHDERQAGAVVAAVAAWPKPLQLFALPRSVVARMAVAAGIDVVAEGFADRAYTANGELVPRSQPGAVRSDTALVTAQAVRLAARASVRAIDGSELEMPVASLCLHGDTPGAVDLARATRQALEAAGVTVVAGW